MFSVISDRDLKHERERKFSTLHYASERRHQVRGVQRDRDQPSDLENELPVSGFTNFQQIVEMIRGELASFRGKTDEERASFSEMLNRAILGFEGERMKLLAIIHDMLARNRVGDRPPPGSPYRSLSEAVFAEVVGLNVLELILNNKEGLEEIQVIGKQIFEIRNGRVTKSAHELKSVRELERIQQNLVLFNNESFNYRKKWAEVALRDGSRVTMTGFGYTAEPTLTIRLYTIRHYDLVILASPELETISERMRQLIQIIQKSYFNMVVIGPTNSGKSHFIKAFIAELPDEERIITIESRYELMLKRDFPHKNIIEYEVDDEDRLHDSDQAFKLALRQSPQRICNAEIRDDDANIYVRACTRGHAGSITSVHVNELEDVPEAITDMCMLDRRNMDPGRLVKRITEYVTQIGFEMSVVHGKRKIVRIGEFLYSNGEVTVLDWVRYNDSLGDWEYPLEMSRRAKTRIMKHDPEGLKNLLTEELAM